MLHVFTLGLKCACAYYYATSNHNIMSAQNSNSQRRTFLVEDLVSQCQHYIAMHSEEFPISHLSLLPVSTRRDILWRLPLADVCQLEDTEFTQGLDMIAYCIITFQVLHNAGYVMVGKGRHRYMCIYTYKYV